MLQSPPSVRSVYLVPFCTQLDLSTFACSGYTFKESINSYQPPFIYNNMCSTALIVNYVPVLIYMNTLIAFVKPFLIVSLIILTKRSKRCSTIKGIQNSVLTQY